MSIKKNQAIRKKVSHFKRATKLALLTMYLRFIKWSGNTPIYSKFMTPDLLVESDQNMLGTITIYHHDKATERATVYAYHLKKIIRIAGLKIRVKRINVGSDSDLIANVCIA